jgi:WD repeat-containing protein 76
VKLSLDIGNSELEREANIARNRALLEKLDLKQAVAKLGIEKKAQHKTQAKPIQPAKRAKRENKEDIVPRRQSARLRVSVIDPNESPSKKRKREAEEEEKRAKEAEERLAAEERERIQKRPRHHDLDLPTLVDDTRASGLPSLSTTWQTVSSSSGPRRVGDVDAFVFEEDRRNKQAVDDLTQKLQSMKVVARAKVTPDRIYSAAYHPEITKDLIFFGGESFIAHSRHFDLSWDRQTRIVGYMGCASTARGGC